MKTLFKNQELVIFPMKDIGFLKIVVFKVTAILCILLFIGACSNFPPITKNGYIKDFVDFVKEVELNHENYTAEEWKKADVKFEKYADTYFEKYKEKMDTEEISKVNILKGKYIGYELKGKSVAMIKEIMSSFKDIIEESNGVIESLSSELDSLAVFDEQ